MLVMHTQIYTTNVILMQAFVLLVSLDDSLIDFESRKVKERRAYDEVSSGKYRHPNFVTSKYFEVSFYIIELLD